MMWYGGGWGGWIMMTVLMLLFWGGLLTAIVLAARAFGADSRARSSPPASPRADELLSERFARGEIDDEEFRRRMALLREHR
ncbi:MULTISPECIES: SHOCT domain-containing protein [Mycolicibacterium]|jgi:putative membrane protein|nr:MULTISPECIES: SHOCT domain-containing protein [Mycolicibacterium]MCA4725253.1 SHOCT domain-containing protein [Mycolicibacterium fortuitum]MCV7139825.1 SHOCT domain-containing protein [Mycolicibacterium fortuitum]MDG5769363.1 SHOCT domain-containing protein [Mycolicibacterium fortuitum]MDG5785011.1 SHOCT domain-containing protein [Mycolicibacterium fortuitum]UBV12755.1 SHOCT domain-containing protein [Mycolicibacterium fortuitum]